MGPQPESGGRGLRGAGGDSPQVPAASVTKHLLEPAAELLCFGIDRLVSAPISRISMQPDEHIDTAADGAADLFVAAASSSGVVPSKSAKGAATAWAQLYFSLR